MAWRDVIYRVIAKYDGGQVNRGFARMKTDAQRTSERIEKLGRVAGRAFIAIGVAIGASARLFAQYEESIVRAGIAIGATEKEMESLGAVAMEVGATTQRSAAEAARGLEILGLAGFSAKEAMEALKPAVDLAVIANQSVGESTEQLTGILKSFGLEAADASQIIEQLTFLQANLKVTASELARHMSYAGGAARTLGVDFAEAATLAGVMNEVLGDKAGRSLDSLFTALSKNSKELKAVGINVFDTLGSFRGMVKIIEDVEFALEGLSQEEAVNITQLLGSKLAIRGLNAITAAGAENIGKLSKATREANGVVEEFLTKIGATLAGEFAEMKSALEKLVIVLGKEFKEELVLLIVAVKDLANWLSDSPGNLGYWVKKTLWWTGSFYAASKLVKALIAIRVYGLLPLIGAFKAGRIAAGLFWGVTTLGLSTIIAFAPEAYTLLKKILGFYEEKSDAVKGSVRDLQNQSTKLEESLDKINKKLEEYRDHLSGKTPNTMFTGQRKNWLEIKISQLEGQRFQIEADLESSKKDLRAAREAAAKPGGGSGGGGEGIIDSEADVAAGIAGARGGDGESDPEESSEVKAQKRIAWAKAKLLAEEQEKKDQADQEAKEKAEEEAKERADKITRARELAAANALEAADFFAQSEKERVDELNEFELETLLLHLENVQEIKDQARRTDLENETYYAELRRKGASETEIGIAKFSTFMQGSKIASVKDYFQKFEALSSSNAKALKVIGKAAALASLAIRLATDVPETYTKTFAALAWIPVPGAAQVLAGLAAASVAATAVAGIARVTGLQQGGIVRGQGGDNSLGDNKVISALRSGEMVIPGDTTRGLLEEFKQRGDTALDDEGGGGGGGAGEMPPIHVIVELDGQVVARKVIGVMAKDGILQL